MGIPLLDIFDLGSKIIDKIWPDPAKAAEAKLQLAQLQQQGALAELQAEVTLSQAQANINSQESSNQNIFVSGWRPFVGWVCGAALAYSFIVQPFIQFLAVLVHLPFDPKQLPVLDWGMLGQLLFGMLGLAGMRTFEKVQGLNPGH